MYNNLRNINKEFLVAIYIRLSKEDENISESESIINQKTLLTKYVNDLGYKLIDIYIDDGFTGTNFERPAFKKMLKDIELGKINMVITKDLSRLSRDYIGTGEYVEKWFPLHNVRYVALTDNIDTFLDNTNNDIAPFKAILNDMYAKDLSKKIRTALHTMQMEGKWVGGIPPFGYKVNEKNKNKLVIDEIEAPIVKRIYNLFLCGKKINEIVSILNKDNIPTFSITRNRNFIRNGNCGNIYGTWCSTSIKKILKNRLYTGDLIQNRRQRLSYKYRKIINNPESDWIIVENTHDAIIEKEIFNKVQSLLPKQNQRTDKKELFLLDGLLKCADCNHNIGIRPRRNNGKSTTVCNYYRTNTKTRHFCTSHGLDYDSLEKGVKSEISKLIKLLDNKKIENAILEKHKINQDLKKYQKIKEKLIFEINTLKNNLDMMYIEKLENKIDEEMYNRIKSKINNDLKIKNNKIIKIDNILKTSYDEQKIINKIKNELNYLKSNKVTRELILKLIKKVSIHQDGNIDIYFNFKELKYYFNKCDT